MWRRQNTLRQVAWIALLAFLSSTGLPLYESHGLIGADDAACLGIGGPGSNATPTLSARVSDDQPPTHCAVCHLLRAVNGTVTPLVASLTVPEASAVNASLVADPTRATPCSIRASRAPPLQA